MKRGLARRLASVYAELHELCTRELCVEGSPLADLVRRWRGHLLPREPTPEAVAEAITFTLLARAQGLEVPWVDAAMAALGTRLATFQVALNPAETGSADVYEAFLRLMQPHQRRAEGVFFTPAPLVRAQVRLAADLLVERLGCASGFGDAHVQVIDPAAGDGAYPLAAVADTIERSGPVQTLPERIVAFEPRVGAAALLRARLATALGASDVDVRVEDALRADWRASGSTVVCLGNPPYRRGPAASTARLGAFLDADASVHLKNLYNAYVYFWRWSLATVFEQRAGPGVVCLVTPASFLSGPGFGGIRSALRGALDELWILDLGGDGRGARPSDNVFAIQSPVAVSLGVRYGAARGLQPTRVWYAHLQGSRTHKLQALDRLRSVDDVHWLKVDGGNQATFVGRRTTAYHAWPRLTELFPWHLSGCQVKRTWPIGPSPDVLRRRWQHLLELDGADRERAFRRTRDRSCTSTPPALLDPVARHAPLGALARGAPPPEPVRYAYRSFDRQWLLADARLGDFMRPRLWAVAGPRQVFLTSFLTGSLGPGPAAVVTAHVPDLDHFRGSFGGRAVVPLWLDREGTRPNVSPGLTRRLEQRFGCAVSAEDVFAYCYALLGSTAYAQRFGSELVEPGPRVPMHPSAAAFGRGVGLGRELLWLHTFGARVCAGRTMHGAARCVRPLVEQPSSFGYDPARGELRVGDGVFAPVESGVWNFSVSGLRIVRSWLGYRVLPAKHPSVLDNIRPEWTTAMSAELVELLWLLERTLALQPALAALLDEVVA